MPLGSPARHRRRGMELGIVGLGRMGANIARRLMRRGHACVVYDKDPAAGAGLLADGARVVASLEDLVAALSPPRAVWVMLPAGDATQGAMDHLAARLQPGDTLIDGGNSYWKDDIARAAALRPKGIAHLDVGTSGGVWGLERGYCLMIGGETEAVERLAPIFAALAPGHGGIARTPGRDGPPSPAEEGYLHAGGPGAGHFVKMVHNGIEYGMMQAMAEGLDVLRSAASPELAPDLRLDLEVAEIAEVWRRGSVITSWLLDLTAEALARDPGLDGFSGVVADSGEGRWCVEAAVAEAVPAPVLTAALYARFRSRRHPAFADKVLSAMRRGFGGHVEAKAGKGGA
ncbi:MAG: decarboxylating 6-phosphogluconate dehydrogenase [Hyphomicrobiaceae bacterium]|nr:decarboxylating 6-phosphogluconate dehydrogenase [Hyphomicrobiaceae bacterium]